MNNFTSNVKTCIIYLLVGIGRHIYSGLLVRLNGAGTVNTKCIYGMRYKLISDMGWYIKIDCVSQFGIIQNCSTMIEYFYSVFTREGQNNSLRVGYVLVYQFCHEFIGYASWLPQL